MGAYIVRPTTREQVQAILLCALCAIAFLGEGLSPGQALLPFVPEVYEPLRSEALADSRVTAADLMLGNREMGDKFNQSIAWDRITQSRLLDGEIPLWTRDIAGGVPFVPQMGQVYQPWNLLLFFVPSAKIYGIWYLLHLVGFGWLAYRFFRRMAVSHEAALFGIVCVVLGLWTQARIHHNVILTAALPCFGMLSCVHAIFYELRRRRSVGLLALGTGLSFLSGFAVTSLQIAYLCTAFAIFLAWQERDWRPLLYTALGLLIGGILSLAQMGPVLRAAAESARDPATVELLKLNALVPMHSLGMIWPDLFHWSDPVIYDLDGTTRMSLAAFFGLPFATSPYMNFPETAFGLGSLASVICLGAGRGSSQRRRMALFFAVVAGLGLMLAMALPPVLQLSAIVPGAQAGDLRRYLFLVAICTSILAAFGADHLHRSQSRSKTSLIALGLILALSLIGTGIHLQSAEGLTDWYAGYAQWRLGEQFPGITDAAQQFRGALLDGEAAANRAHGLQTFGRASLCAGLGILLLIWRRPWTLRALTLLLIIELIDAGSGTIVAVDAERLTSPPHLLEPLLKASRDGVQKNGVRPRLQRLEVSGKSPSLSTLLPPNLGAFYGVEDLAAYNPLPKRRMEELFLAIEPDRDGKPSLVFHGAGVGSFRRRESLVHPLSDLLGIQFILSDVVGRVDLPPGIREVTPSDGAGTIRLFERSTCLPRATFVDRARVIIDKSARLQQLSSSTVDVAHSVILEDPDAPKAEGDGQSTARVEILSHRDSEVQIRVQTEEPGYLRLADPYDAGWTVTVDQQSKPLWIADHYLRAVYLEPGDHEVVFRYNAAIVHAPQWISLLALSLVIGLCFWPQKRRQEV